MQGHGATLQRPYLLLPAHPIRAPGLCRLPCSPQDGHTPLMVAVRTGSVELVEVLIDAGAPVDFKNEVGLGGGEGKGGGRVAGTPCVCIRPQ